MQITRNMLDEATAQGILQRDQVETLWKFISDKHVDTPTFKAAHILYYLGGMTAIGAMTLFMTLGWERYRGVGLVVIAAVYCIMAIALTEALLRRKLVLP